MPLVNRTISNLFGGVSQQPAGIRLDNQCEEMINAYPSITDGLVKRPPTEFISPINSEADEDSMFHTINRDGAEKYIVIFTGDASTPIKIYDLLGAEKTVAYGELDEDLALTAGDAPKAYISGGTPSQDIAAVTVADYTVVVNRAKTISMLSPLAEDHLPVAIITIPHGIADQVYQVFVNGDSVAAVETGNSNSPETWRTVEIAQQIYTQMRAALPDVDEWHLTVSGSTIIIVNLNGNDFTLKTEDTWGDQALIGIKETVRRFEDLPETIPGGFDHNYVAVTIHEGHRGYYNIYVDGVRKVHHWLADITPTNIAQILYTDLVASLLPDPAWRASVTGPIISIWRADGAVPNVTADITEQPVSDPNTITYAVHENFNTTDITIQIRGEVTSTKGKYYVQWNNESVDGKSSTGGWIECPRRGIATELDPTTMPHRLVRMSDGTFVFAPIAWEPRGVGDEISAPDPTFVGTEINDVFFFKNRLGFLAKGSTILSRAGEFFDFFPTTATDVLDDDPIDAESSSKQVAVLRYGVPFQSQLVLFSDQQQFSLGSGVQLFTPKSAAGDLATSVAVDRCEPVSIGSNIYFASPSGNFTSIREMFVAADTLITDSADVTAHCPVYIPANIKRLAACEGKDTVFVLSSDEPNSIYVYKFYWNGDEKAQSAWGKWTFAQKVLYMDVVDNFLYLLFEEESAISASYTSNTIGVTTEGDSFMFDDDSSAFLTALPGISIGDTISVSGFDNSDYNRTYEVEFVDEQYITVVNPFTEVQEGVEPGNSITINLFSSSGALSLDRINLETKEATSGLAYRLLLDRQDVLVGSFDTDHTNFTAPCPVVSTDKAFNRTTKECVAITVIDGFAGTFSVPGNWSSAVVIFGRPYMLDFRFSEFGMKSADPKVYSRAGRGQLRTINLSFEDTMSFDVSVSTPGRSDSTQRFRASVPVTGEKRFMTLGDTRATRVSIKSDSHLPCKFGGASYETMYAQRSR